MSEISDEDLVAQACQGNSAAVGALYERYHQRIFRYLYYRIGSKEVAEDLTSDVFLKMVQALSGFRSRSGTFQAWLFQIARNTAIDHFRRTNPHLETELDEKLNVIDKDIVSEVDRSLTSDLLLLALQELSTDQRNVLLLRFIAGMPISQVAKTLHKTEDSIKGLQRRGLLNLREVMNLWEVSYVRG